MIPLRIKLAYTSFVCVLVPTYWVVRGPVNFLWGSDLALLITMVALWSENCLLASMMALATLLPESTWIVDLLLRALGVAELLGPRGTSYMFDPGSPLFVRGLSLFHVGLPVVVIWLVWRLGYDRRAWAAQTALAWIVLPLTYLVTLPARNINLVFGIGDAPQTWMPGPIYVACVMLFFSFGVYLPTHLVLLRIFDPTRGTPPANHRRHQPSASSSAQGPRSCPRSG